MSLYARASASVRLASILHQEALRAGIRNTGRPIGQGPASPGQYGAGKFRGTLDRWTRLRRRPHSHFHPRHALARSCERAAQVAKSKQVADADLTEERIQVQDILVNSQSQRHQSEYFEFAAHQ